MASERRARRQRKTLAVELVDHFGPLHQRLAFLGGDQRIPADLDQTLAVPLDLAAEMIDQHLRAEADAEKRPVLAERNLQPFGLAADELILVIGAHRPAEHHRAGMLVERFGQVVAERRPPDVELETAFQEQMADAAGTRQFLMQHHQHGRPCSPPWRPEDRPRLMGG